MMTALLFLIDLAGPRKRSKKAYSQTTAQPFPFPVQLKPVPKPQGKPQLILINYKHINFKYQL